MTTENSSPLSLQSRIKICAVSAASNMVAVLPGQPLDVLKTRRHTNPANPYSIIIQNIRQESPSVGRTLYVGLGSKIALMGIKGFYRGDLITNFPLQVKNQLPEEFVKQHPLAPTLLSIPAITAVDVLIRTPLEAANRLRMTGGISASWGDIWKQVKQKPYAGIFPTTTKDLIGWGIFLGVDDTVKLHIKKDLPSNLDYISPFISASLTACIKTYSTNPLDIIITSMQKDHLPLKDALHRVKLGGWRGACAGAVPRLIMNGSDSFIGSSIRSWADSIKTQEKMASRER